MTNLLRTLGLGIDARKSKTGAQEYDKSTKQVARSSAQAGKAIGGVTKLLGGLAAGLGAIALARGAISTITEFEEKLTTLGGVTSATEAELALFEQTARELGAATRFSAGEAAEGLINLSRAGFAVGESTAAIRPVLNLATSQLLDLGTSANIVAETVRGFALEANQAGEAANILANQANSSNTDVRLLGSGLSFVAATARLSGSDLAETSAALGVLSDNAIKGSRAGTNLNQIFLKLAKPTSEASRLFRELGIDLDDVNPEKVGLTQALDTLEPVLQRNAAAAVVFGARNAAAARILAGNTEAIREQTAENRELGDVIGELADKQALTLTGRFAALRSAASELALVVGRDSGLAGQFGEAVTATANLLRALAGNAQALDQTTNKLENVGAFGKFVAGAFRVTTVTLRAFFTQVERLRGALVDGLIEALNGTFEALGKVKVFGEELNDVFAALNETFERAEDGDLPGFNQSKAAQAERTLFQLEQAARRYINVLANDPDNEAATTRLEAINERINKQRELVQRLTGATGDNNEKSKELRMTLAEIVGEFDGLDAPERKNALGEALDIDLSALDAALDKIRETDEAAKSLENTFLNLIARGIIFLGEQSKNVATEFEKTWRGAGEAVGRGVGDVLTTLVTEGDITGEQLRQIGERIIQQLLEIFGVQQLVGAFGQGGLSLGAAITPGVNAARGMIVSPAGSEVAQSGTIIGSPTIVQGRGRRILAGEGGKPEAVVPLERGAGGKLGIAASGVGGGSSQTFNFTINTPDADSFRKSQKQIVSDARRAGAISNGR